MINTIVLETLVGNYKQPLTGQTVQVHNYDAADVPNNAPNGSLIGNTSEVSGAGLYTIDIIESKKVTIAVNGLCLAGNIGVMVHGDKALDDSVDTTAIVDAAVTTGKTDFAGGL